MLKRPNGMGRDGAKRIPATSVHKRIPLRSTPLVRRCVPVLGGFAESARHDRLCQDAVTSAARPPLTQHALLILALLEGRLHLAATIGFSREPRGAAVVLQRARLLHTVALLSSTLFPRDGSEKEPRPMRRTHVQPFLEIHAGTWERILINAGVSVQSRMWQ